MNNPPTSTVQPIQADIPNFPHIQPKPLIEMNQIVKIFHNGSVDFPALKGINLQFFPGEFVSIVGRSGSGKSTLANMITGIDHPTSGTVCIRGTNIHSLNESKMAVWRGNNLGIVFQFFQLMPILTLFENIKLPMDLCNKYEPGERNERARELLDLVGMTEFADQLPDEISGGQQQSIAIARALANDPPILIADEPTGNLDSRTANSIFNIFTNLADKGKTIIMVTHDQSLAERTGRIVHIADGSLVDEAANERIVP